MIKHASPTLLERLDAYALTRDLQDSTLQWYRANLRAADAYSGRPLTISSLSDDLLNQTLATMAAAGRAPEYQRAVRNAVAAVWRDAADDGLCDPPRKLRRIRATPRPVLVWSVDDIRTLLRAAARLTGCFRRTMIARAPYFVSIIRMSWDSPLRRRDLHQLRLRDISADFVWLQNKTGRPVRVCLRQATLEHIRQLGRGPDDLVWPRWGKSDTVFGHAFQRLVADAGIQPGPWRTIRASAGTAAEAVTPGAGHLLLGNTRAVFERHYLDISQIPPPRPPEID